MSCGAKKVHIYHYIMLLLMFIWNLLAGALSLIFYFSQLTIQKLGIINPPLDTEVKAYISVFNQELTANNTTLRKTDMRNHD